MSAKPIDKSIVKKQSSPEVLKSSAPAHQQAGPLARRQNQLPAEKNQERAVQPLDAKFADLLSAPKSVFDFRSQILPIGAILFFSLVLVLFYHFSGGGAAANKAGEGRTVSGEYSEEKVCTDHSDGTKTCTTKTKLRRQFQ